MEGLSRAVGAGVPFRWQGEAFILDPMTLEDFGVVEQHILSKRPNPIEMVKEHLDGLPLELQEKLLETAYRDARKLNTVSADDIVAFLNSAEGLAFTIWMKLDKRYPGRFKLDDMFQVIQSLPEAEQEKLATTRDQASGIDNLGNSTGPEEPPTMATTAGPAESSRGDGSYVD